MNNVVSRELVRMEVRSFVLKNFLVGESADSLLDSSALVSTGVISSLATLELVAFLEERFGVTLRHHDLTSDRLDSVERVVALVEELRQLDVVGRSVGGAA